MSVAHVTTQKYDLVAEAISFEQGVIVQKSVKVLRRKCKTRPDPDHLLRRTFTIYQLRRIHEAVLGQNLDKDRFRRKMEGKLESTGEMSIGSVGKPAQSFRRKR